jgi:hypothetical protein
MITTKFRLLLAALALGLPIAAAAFPGQAEARSTPPAQVTQAGDAAAPAARPARPQRRQSAQAQQRRTRQPAPAPRRHAHAHTHTHAHAHAGAPGLSAHRGSAMVNSRQTIA